jgi:small-conductance mechanosensitive channel
MRLSGRALSTVFLVVVVAAVWLGYYFTSEKLESTRSGMEHLLKQQATEIQYLEGALGEERLARELEFFAAHQARQSNREFQDKALATMNDVKTEVGNQTVQILDAVRSTQASAVSAHAAAQNAEQSALHTRQTVKAAIPVLKPKPLLERITTSIFGAAPTPTPNRHKKKIK